MRTPGEPLGATDGQAEPVFVPLTIPPHGGLVAGLEPAGKRPRRLGHSIIELVVIVAVAVGLAFGLEAFVVKPYRIPSGSMEPTLTVGQRVLVNRLALDFGEPHVGQIVVFHPPAGAEHERCGPVAHQITLGAAPCELPVPDEASVTYVKRVVAGPGDEIYISDGHVFLKTAGDARFVRESDPYIKACGQAPECNLPTPIRIAPGHWFMMGDNRGDSDDSRYWGPVPTAWMIGPVFATYWPISRLGTF